MPSRAVSFCQECRVCRGGNCRVDGLRSFRGMLGAPRSFIRKGGSMRIKDGLLSIPLMRSLRYYCIHHGHSLEGPASLE